MSRFVGNTSHAVRAQRIEPKDSLDFFPTPPWATRALCRYLERTMKLDISAQSVWEPACGQGHMARALRESFSTVYASDLHDYGSGARIKDFTLGTFDDSSSWPGPVDWIITNPPFNKAAEFIDTALPRARRGVAMFARSTFAEGETRHRKLFSVNPPAIILQFAERVLLLKNRVRRKGSHNPDTGKPYSTATSYAWFIWSTTTPKTSHSGFDWIPPCQRELERDEDYREVIKI